MSINSANFISAKKIEDCSGKKQQILFHVWNIAMLLLSSAGICTLSLTLAIGYFDIQFFFDYFRYPILFLLNWLPIFLVQVILYCIFGRQWIAFAVNALLFVGASVGNYYKIEYRCEPFTFEDVSMISTALGVAGEIDLTPNVRIIFAVCASVAGCVFLGFFAKGRISRRIRLIGLLAACIAVFSLYPVYSSEDIYENKTEGRAVETDFNTPDYTIPFIKRGFVYPFIYSVFHSSALPPDDYDPSVAEAVLSAYSDADIPEDKRVNLIVCQLESFADLRTMGITGISDDVYSWYDELKSETLTGVLLTDTYGGGTIETEHSVITGETGYQSPPKTYPSYAWYLRDQGYTTVGSHPNDASFYHRGIVNTYLGFENYRFMDNYYLDLMTSDNHTLSDQVLFEEILKEYQSLSAEGKSVISFNITYQGHIAYEDANYGTPEGYFSNSSCSTETSEILNRYLYSVNDTLAQIRKFIDALRDDSNPVVVVFYGDHKPRLKNYDELGVNNEPDSQEGISNYFATEYLIWANDAAREITGNEFCGEGPMISPCFLMPYLFRQLGWEGNAYAQYMRSVMETVLVINSKGYYLEDGVFTATPDAEITDAVDIQKMVQYYLSSTFTHS